MDAGEMDSTPSAVAPGYGTEWGAARKAVPTATVFKGMGKPWTTTDKPFPTKENLVDHYGLPDARAAFGPSVPRNPID
jgi:hypothetical protein